MKTKAFILSVAAALVALSHPTAEACTGITLKGKRRRAHRCPHH